MRFLTKEQLITLHSLLIGETGGIHGLRDEGRLKEALAAPFMTFDSLDLYKSDVEKAVRLSFELVRGHPFIDGNKRIGVEALLIVLFQNVFSWRLMTKKPSPPFFSWPRGRSVIRNSSAGLFLT